MSNCLGYNPDTHKGSYPGGVCFIFYAGSWDGAGWENGGCHSPGNGNTITDTDGAEGGTCYRKNHHFSKKSGPTSTTATTTEGATTTAGSEASVPSSTAKAASATEETTEAATQATTKATADSQAGVESDADAATTTGVVETGSTEESGALRSRSQWFLTLIVALFVFVSK
jgi:hypothetical protein